MDPDDWRVDDATFLELETRAGPFRSDLFASDFNYRIKPFFSVVVSKEAAAMDAFSQDWGKDFVVGVGSSKR